MLWLVDWLGILTLAAVLGLAASVAFFARFEDTPKTHTYPVRSLAAGVFTFVLVLVLGLTARPAYGQAQCGDRDKIVQRLDVMYGERFLGGGVINNQQILEMFFNPETDKWTVLYTYANGVACIAAVGSDWRSADREDEPAEPLH